jgi:hypothetical protein
VASVVANGVEPDPNADKFMAGLEVRACMPMFPDLLDPCS